MKKDKLEAIDDLANEVLEASNKTMSTHWQDCHVYHAPCLAARVRDILKGMG